MTEVPTEKTYEQMRSEIRRSYYIPDNYRVPVGRNRKNYLRSYQNRYFKWRYRLIENRRIKLEKLAHQLHLFHKNLERFVLYDEWCERQMRQYQDLCFVIGNGIDDAECPDRYDIEEILSSRMNEVQERLKRHKEQYPNIRVVNQDVKHWREYLENLEAQAEQEYAKWRAGKHYLFRPAEERRTDKMLRRHDNILDTFVKEVQYDSGLLNKKLMPDCVREMFVSFTQRHSRFRPVLQQVLVSTPYLDPTLDEMDANNSKHLDRMRMLDEMRQVEGATVAVNDVNDGDRATVVVDGEL